MPIAHACPLCGDQLTRAPAAALCQLPVIICPCGFAAVRRRHPIVARWRVALRVQRAITRLVLQLLFLLLLSLGTAGFGFGFQHEAKSLQMSPLQILIAACGGPHGSDRSFRSWFFTDYGFLELVIFAIVSFIAGMWLTAGLAHWRWPRQFLAWAALIAGFLWIELILWPLSWLLGLASHQSAMYSGPGVAESADLAFILGLSMTITLLGIPPGRALSRLGVRSQRGQFRRKLARLRKRKHSE